MNSELKIVIDPLYAPCLSFWAILARAGETLIEARSNYRKGSYRNRCHIYGANGLLRLSIPLRHGKHQRKRMDEIRISYDHPWQDLHWESLCIAYRSSPFFEYYEAGLRPFFEEELDLLIEFNLRLMTHLADLIGIPWKAVRTTAYTEHYPTDWTDLREMISPHPLRGISGHLSSEPYSQVFGARHGFIHDLSILDLLFHKGPASRDYLLREIRVDLSSVGVPVPDEDVGPDRP